MAFKSWVAMNGTYVNDTILADYAAADAMHYSEFNWEGGFNVVYSWNRKIDGLSGDDTIKRDQPGDYKSDPSVGGMHTKGHVGVAGGSGTDTIDYSLFQGPLEVDLRPLGEAVANTFYSHVVSVFNPAIKGYAKALDPSGVGVHGMDFLHSFENVIGTDFDDHITGDDGANDLQGGDGEDTIYGKGGSDTIDGGDDADKLHGDGGTDVIDGGDGNDKIWGGEENDVINGGAGNDWVSGGTGVDIVNGAGGGDKIYGGDQGDILMGGNGEDTIEGQDGDDQVWGGNHDDELFGNAGNDTMWGGSGNDEISGGSGDNTVYGQSGDDKIKVENFDLLIDGGTGFDTVELTGTGNTDFYVSVKSAGNGHMEQLNSPGADYTELKGIEAVKTGAGNDVISFGGFGATDNKAFSGLGNDTVMLGNGDDSAWGGSGNDLLIGHTGNDFLDGGADNDDVRGGYGNDTLDGDSGDDTLNAGAGDDTVFGGSGSDEVRGGAGADELSGGSSSDTFVWKDGDYGLDTLIDFQLGTDKIDVDGFLANPPIAINDDYVGKVAALPTAFEDTTGLYALTDNGWSAFAWVEGYDAATLADAIQTGELFGVWTPPELGNVEGGGPGRIDSFARQGEEPGQDIVNPEYDILL